MTDRGPRTRSAVAVREDARTQGQYQGASTEEHR